MLRPYSQDRFMTSLTALRDKHQRTVYRLTLVAGWNAEDAGEYAKLIDLGQPDFIEIKGMTYCGSTGASSLTMKNVPYHDDVKKFGESLCAARIALQAGEREDSGARAPAGGDGDDDGSDGGGGGGGAASVADGAAAGSGEVKDEAEVEVEFTGGTPAGADYGLACEHQHSCCILLARKDPYLVDGEWHTWINYEKFQDLTAAGKPFKASEYMMPTPKWATWGAEEGGFDPEETRVRKVRNHPGTEAALAAQAEVNAIKSIAALKA
jgi:tRNA wybutosine-synthesizing protein 1